MARRTRLADRPAMRWLVIVVGGWCLGCDTEQLTRLDDDLRAAPSQLDFGRVVVGQLADQQVVLTNPSRGALEISVEVRGDAFTAVEPPAMAQPGETTVSVAFRPDAARAYDGTLSIVVRGGGRLTVPMSGEGAPIPPCTSDRVCHESTWSPSLGRCVETPVEDGLACAGDACLEAASCVRGECIGTTRSCDDGDPCTLDQCDPMRGCEHQAGVSCPSLGACQVGACEPGVGCVLHDAQDGTPCGPRRSCTEADVCIAGQCVVRDPPDDFVCADPGPCQGEGRCQNDVCVVPQAQPIVPSWQLGAPQPDGGPPTAWADLLVAPDGGVTVSSYFMTPPLLQANGPNPLTLPTGARRCIHWRGLLACADYPGAVTAGVSAIDEASTTTLWTYSAITTDLPDYAGPTVQVFLARLMAQSDQVLLALFEARTLNPDGSDPRCRQFALVALDAQGHSIAGRRVEHPVFGTCIHPHPYGAAVDTQGNVYLAFTPSDLDNPAHPLTDTLLFSYSPQLIPRWVQSVPGLKGGELSVAQGRLFHEYSRETFSTATGLPTSSLAEPFGLGVIARDAIVPAPAAGTALLEAVDPGSLLPRWQRRLARGFFAGGPLALAQLVTARGPRPVVITFDVDGLTTHVGGTDLDTGAALFHCPIELGHVPFQVAPLAGGIVVTSDPRPVVRGTGECAECDPKFARTRATFSSFPLPGLLPGEGSWPAAHGGNGHDHREDALP